MQFLSYDALSLLFAGVAVAAGATIWLLFCAVLYHALLRPMLGYRWGDWVSTWLCVIPIITLLILSALSTLGMY